MTYRNISIDMLRSLLRYDPKTGLLYWKPRPASMFKDGHRTSSGNANNWNSVYAETVALNSPNKKGYLAGVLLGGHVLAHRAIWALVTGAWPDQHIDHINGNPADNRIENLRQVSNHENRLNVKLQSNNSSGRCGVRVNPKNGKWEARIKFFGKERYLGSYFDFGDACQARACAERDLGFHPNHGRNRAKEVLRAPLSGER